MQHTEDTEINIKKEEDDIDIKKEDEEEEEDFDNTQHPDADVELLRVMKVEIVCNHLQPHITGSTLSRPAFAGTPRCDKCGIFIHTERAHRCDLCGGTFCLSHKFSKRSNCQGEKSRSSKRTGRSHLPLFIRKLEINKYISKCNPRLGVEPRVEAFSAWAEGVFLGLSAEGKEIVPQAVLQTVCDKWKSQEY